MSAGRPPDEAPPNHKTVSEVASILGVTPSAVRQMIQSGRLPFMADENGEPVTTQGGQPRYYIPYLAVEEELRRRQRAVTPGDIEKVEDQLQAQAARVLEEMVKELQQHDTKIAGVIEEADRKTQQELINLRREVTELRQANKKYQDEILSLVRPAFERAAEEPERRGFWARLFGG